jgi:hypothetical protein
MMMMMMMMITSTHGQRGVGLGTENYGKFQASVRQSLPCILEYYRKYKEIGML